MLSPCLSVSPVVVLIPLVTDSVCTVDLSSTGLTLAPVFEKQVSIVMHVQTVMRLKPVDLPTCPEVVFLVSVIADNASASRQSRMCVSVVRQHLLMSTSLVPAEAG